jgi:hypothetical protein
MSGLVLLVAVAGAGMFLGPVFGTIGLFMEGFGRGRFSAHLMRLLRRRNVRRYQRLIARLESGQQLTGKEMEAVDRLRGEDLTVTLMPTYLGTVIRAAEMYPPARYGLEPLVMMPRLLRLVPPDARQEYADRREDLQFAEELAGAMLLSSLVTLAFLYDDGTWLLVPAACLVLAWAAYRNAVSAALAYGEVLRVMFDLYRRSLYEAFRISLPASSPEGERELGRMLSMHLLLGFPVPEPASPSGNQTAESAHHPEEP